MTTAAVATEEIVEVIPEETTERPEPLRQPRYHVILWDDDVHTFDYVINLVRKLFGRTLEEGFKIAEEVHLRGRAILLTTTREHAELKRDQIHSLGKDHLSATCQGSMWSTIEAET